METDASQNTKQANLIKEPRFDLGTLAQTSLPLEIIYQPFRGTNRTDLANLDGQEITVSFRNEVPNIPSTTYGTFGLYRYPAKFIPQVVAYAIETWGQPGQKMIDPYAGSGTTGLVARLYGLDYELWDLNPLLEVLHSIAVMPPRPVPVKNLVETVMKSTQQWLPQWINLHYWYPEPVLPLLSRVWGFYHNLEDEYTQKLLTVPLLKVTRIFSYNDPQRQKLSRSPKAIQRVDTLLNGDWQHNFAKLLYDEVLIVLQKLNEYQTLKWVNRNVQANIVCGKDSLDLVKHCEPEKNQWNMLITSPPYLQAQEYIRCSKMDLFWLGYTEAQIRDLAKQELPYKHVEPIPILSETYAKYRHLINEPHLRQMYDQYFHSVLGTLTHLSEYITERMCLFVGEATVRGRSIPIDRIIAEHFVSQGWQHEVTLIDKIVARVMFRAKVNPATGIEDRRMPTENLVVLRKKN